MGYKTVGVAARESGQVCVTISRRYMRMLRQLKQAGHIDSISEGFQLALTQCETARTPLFKPLEAK